LFHKYCVAQGKVGAGEPSPNTDSILTEIKQLVGKRKAKTRAANYEPRGKAALRQDYSSDQHLQLRRYGLADDAPKPLRSPKSLGPVMRLRHAMAHNVAARYDDLEQLRYACLDTPVLSVR
jgi:hypothetical protein